MSKIGSESLDPGSSDWWVTADILLREEPDEEDDEEEDEGDDEEDDEDDGYSE
jgi:hypothetical protein